MEGQIFQRYHGRENTHSSNALMLFQRLYYYSPTKFYNLIGKIFELPDDMKNIQPSFLAQDTTNGKGSIPDFSIQQESFKLAVEAKEWSKGFDFNQLDIHMANLSRSEYKSKLLIALSRSNEIESQLEKLNEKYKGTNTRVIHLTYIGLYNMIIDREILDPNRDYEFIDILEDYKAYCEHEDLIDLSDDTVMVRACGETLPFNIKYKVYYDGAQHNCSGFKYLALYKDKYIQAIGKIKKIIEAHEEVKNADNAESKEIVYGEVRSYFGSKSIDDSDKEKIAAAIADRRERYHNSGDPHWHYIVDDFVEVHNFKKHSKGGLFRSKIFSLKKDFLIENSKPSMKEIVEAMAKIGGWDQSKSEE